MSATISPLAPKTYPEMPAIDGVRIATAEAGIKYKNRTDVLVDGLRRGHDGGGRLHPVEMPVGAGRFLPRTTCRAARRAMLVVNSGNANAFTGKKGRETTTLTAQGGGQGRRLRRRARSSSPRPA